MDILICILISKQIKSSSEIINASKQFPVQRSYNNKTHGMSNFPHKRQS